MAEQVAELKPDPQGEVRAKGWRFAPSPASGTGRGLGPQELSRALGPNLSCAEGMLWSLFLGNTLLKGF